ncbi:MAG: RepB family DNA primase [Gemmataceae bacterium]|nr:RepB family DNA primase [Gemmataceae bacterium]
MTDAQQYLAALFEPADLVEVRFIETWTEGDRKRSAFVSRHTYPAGVWPGAVPEVVECSRRTRANVFVGVCPRPGRDKGRTRDIAVVRSLWLDLDRCRPAEALARVAGAGLPDPSLVVDSGHGTHLYWRLAEPVTTEVARVEGVIKGLAGWVGGDHTHDLARVLRLPGTMNRKDERNGESPVPCLVHSATDGRHPLSAFEGFAVEVVRPKAGPAARPKAVPAAGPGVAVGGLTKAQRAALDRAIERSAAAGAGTRSQADYALCVWASKLGVDPDDFWPLIEHMGKFGEAGHRYFARTWAKAEAAVHEGRRQAADKLSVMEKTLSDRYGV